MALMVLMAPYGSYGFLWLLWLLWLSWLLWLLWLLLYVRCAFRSRAAPGLTRPYAKTSRKSTHYLDLTRPNSANYDSCDHAPTTTRRSTLVGYYQPFIQGW